MTAGLVLGLWLSETPALAARREALRVLVAARAAGRPVRLLDLRPVPGAPLPDLTDDEQRWLDALLEDGLAWERPTPNELRTALEQSSSVVPLADLARARQPALLWLDATWLRTTPLASLPAALHQAGQILRRAP